MVHKANITDDKQMKRMIKRLAHEILEREEAVQEIVLLGILTRGLPIAEKIAQEITTIEQVKISVAGLDITTYRDDLDDQANHATKPRHQPESLVDLQDKHVVLVDDVIYTGRTVRAALDAVIDFGRPRVIRLAVLVDRGHREVPIRADFVGKNVPTSIREQVKVSVSEIDGVNSIDIYQ